MPAPHIPTAVDGMLKRLGIAIPESGRLHRRVLNQTLIHKGVTPGRRAHFFDELERASMLIDDRHHSKGQSH
jgi:hypothetical protein